MILKTAQKAAFGLSEVSNTCLERRLYSEFVAEQPINHLQQVGAAHCFSFSFLLIPNIDAICLKAH